MERNIAVYSSDGALLQWVDQKRCQRLVDGGRVARVVKTRLGRVRRVTLFRMVGEWKPSFLSDYDGTRYSFRQHLADGHQCHRLAALGDKPWTPRAPRTMGEPLYKSEPLNASEPQGREHQNQKRANSTRGFQSHTQWPAHVVHQWPRCVRFNCLIERAHQKGSLRLAGMTSATATRPPESLLTNPTGRRPHQ